MQSGSGGGDVSPLVDIKPEITFGAYNEQTVSYGVGGTTDSGGSSSCEQIVCKPSPLPSPTQDVAQDSPVATVAR